MISNSSKGFAVNTKLLKAGLAGALVVAFFAGQAAAQEGECSKVDSEANVKAIGIDVLSANAKLSEISYLP